MGGWRVQVGVKVGCGQSAPETMVYVKDGPGCLLELRSDVPPCCHCCHETGLLSGRDADAGHG